MKHCGASGSRGLLRDLEGRLHVYLSTVGLFIEGGILQANREVNRQKTSISAVAEKPRCMVGQISMERVSAQCCCILYRPT